MHGPDPAFNRSRGHAENVLIEKLLGKPKGRMLVKQREIQRRRILPDDRTKHVKLDLGQIVEPIVEHVSLLLKKRRLGHQIGSQDGEILMVVPGTIASDVKERPVQADDRLQSTIF